MDTELALQNHESIDPSDLQISKRVREVFEAGNLTQEELAKELAISQPHVSRLLQGKTPWRKKYLKRVAALYKTTLNALILEAEEIPIVSRIADDQGFPYTATENQKAWIGKAFAPPGELNLEGLYCVQIHGDFFKPFFGPGSLIYARRDSKDIQEDSLVIYVDEEGRGLLRQVKFANDTIILKSLSPSGQYTIRPKTHLRLIDKVEWIKI
ncbi:MAG: helix-turn-helix domain-containing protein [Thermodesulfobacteriota bacterium]